MESNINESDRDNHNKFIHDSCKHLDEKGYIYFRSDSKSISEQTKFDLSNKGYKVIMFELPDLRGVYKIYLE